MTELTVRAETFPIRGVWTISRGSVTAVDVVAVSLRRGDAVGQGECRPYARYDETCEGVMAEIEGLRSALVQGLDRQGLQEALPAGAARNALDCAFWDLEAKEAGVSTWSLSGLNALEPVITAYTLSLDSPEAMGAAAVEQAARPLIKVKLGGDGEGRDLARLEAIRAGAPEAKLIIDANEAWTAEDLRTYGPDLARLGIALVEQPLPAGQDAALDGLERPVPLCADESCHDRASLDALDGRYDLINIKLDKTGGLTEALALKAEAEARGFGIMVGCMMASSLSLAPGVLLAQGAEVVDLDAPLMLAEDRDPPLRYDGSTLFPPDPALWG